MERLQNSLLFLGKFITSPTTIGAIAPSSAALAKQMVQLGNIETARTVLELGPGTGVFTEAICRRLPKDAVFIAIEVDPQLALLLRKKMPEVRTVAGSAEHLDRIMKSYGLTQADSIVSELPFVSFEPALQDRILYAVRQALRPGGTFVTFSYLHARLLPKAKRFRHALQEMFCDVQLSPVVWKNLPPAFVYQCRKPE
ncbi:MAG: methyltransferase domain-containing protein [Planctomycetes bacterium]|jgi:phosphatidylethanolamine/phosphatidyl-N-methylethanolamine N-methyltransferase|nr:methyltransferase domain-containing protein [Planctomycetota bacterium]